MRFILPFLMFFIASSAFAQDQPLPTPVPKPLIDEFVGQDGLQPDGIARRNNVINQQKYGECLALVKKNPAAAKTFVGKWIIDFGGIPARHCEVLAETALGNHDIAARALEDMAQEFRLIKAGVSRESLSDENANLLASFYLQAGNSWMLAGDSTKAYELLSLGLSEASVMGPVRMSLLVDRARSLAMVKDWDAAAKDLTIALTLDNTHLEALLLRASAYRMLEKFEQAKTDLSVVFSQLENDPDALLERGNLNLALDDEPAARADWLTYLRLYPDGPAVEAVRKNLEQLDVKSQ